MVQARHSRWVAQASLKAQNSQKDGNKCKACLKRLEVVWFSNWFFVKPMLIAVVPCIISITMKWYQIHNPDNIPEGVFPDESLAYSSLSWVLGFVLVFRTGQAYNRYWDGARSLHRMTVELFDACSQLIAFAESSKAARAKTDAFTLSIVRLFSLFHGVALQQITEVEDEDIKIIDPTGIEKDQLRFMRSHPRHARPDIVMQWIVRTMTEATHTGVITTPPPIVSRAYQECNSGLVALFEMRTIAELPFPIPYAKMVWILLCVHMFITPFYVVSFTNARFWAGIYAFTSVFSLWCIQYIAIELEQPFGNGVNNLDLAESQSEMNDSLMILLNSKTQWTPDLDRIAKQTPTLDQHTRRISGFINDRDSIPRASMAACLQLTSSDSTGSYVSDDFEYKESESFSPSKNKSSANDVPPPADGKYEPASRVSSGPSSGLHAQSPPSDIHPVRPPDPLTSFAAPEGPPPGLPSQPPDIPPLPPDTEVPSKPIGPDLHQPCDTLSVKADPGSVSASNSEGKHGATPPVSLQQSHADRRSQGSVSGTRSMGASRKSMSRKASLRLITPNGPDGPKARALAELISDIWLSRGKPRQEEAAEKKTQALAMVVEGVKPCLGSLFYYSCDDDHNRTLDRTELQEALTRIPSFSGTFVPTFEFKISELFSEGDGTIDVDEWLDLCEEIPDLMKAIEDDQVCKTWRDLLES